MDTGFGIWNPFLHFLLQEGKDVWPIYWVVGVPLIGCNLSQFPMITASYANHHLQSAYLRVRLGMEVRGNLAKLIINVDSHLIHLFFQHLIPIVGHWPTPPQTSWWDFQRMPDIPWSASDWRDQFGGVTSKDMLKKNAISYVKSINMKSIMTVLKLFGCNCPHFLMIGVHQLITIFTLTKASRDLKSNKLTSSQELF